MSSWERNGGWGGDICVTLCLQRGGGHEKFFRNVAIFWRVAPLLPKRQKMPTFRKFFSCPPLPPLQTHGYTNVPPVACSGRHYTTRLFTTLDQTLNKSIDKCEKSQTNNRNDEENDPHFISKRINSKIEKLKLEL